MAAGNTRHEQLLPLGVLVTRAQGVGLLAAAIYLLVRCFTSPVNNAGVAAADVATAVVGSLLFALTARGLARRNPAARTPSLLLEILCVPVGVGLFQGSRPVWGVLVLGSAVVALVCVGSAMTRGFDD